MTRFGAKLAGGCRVALAASLMFNPPASSQNNDLGRVPVSPAGFALNISADDFKLEASLAQVFSASPHLKGWSNGLSTLSKTGELGYFEKINPQPVLPLNKKIVAAPIAGSVTRSADFYAANSRSGFLGGSELGRSGFITPAGPITAPRSSPKKGFFDWEPPNKTVRHYLDPTMCDYCFGKNKITYNSDVIHKGVKVFQTEHFDIYYYPAIEDSIAMIGDMAELHYPRLVRLNDLRPEERLPIIFYGTVVHWNQGNIYPGTLPEGVLAFTEPVKLRNVTYMRESVAETEETLVHEMEHQFQFVLAETKKSLLSLVPTGQPPLWVTEGYAEYASIGSRIDTQKTALLRRVMQNGEFVPIPKMPGLDGGYGPYLLGHALWVYLAERFGEDKIIQAHRNIVINSKSAKSLVDVNGVINAVFVEVFEKDMLELSDDWQRDLKKKYALVHEEHKSPKEVATALTGGMGFPTQANFGGEISPSGTKIIYYGEGLEYEPGGIWIAPVREKKPEPKKEDDDRPVIEGTGPASKKKDSDKPVKLVEVFRPLNTESLFYISPKLAWSPDEKEFAYSALSHGQGVLDIYSFATKKTRELKLDVDQVLYPSFSPDGQRLVFTGMKGGRTDLYIVNKDGSGLERLTHDFRSDIHPAWSPDGRKIAFVTDEPDATAKDDGQFSNYKLAIYDLETKKIRILPGQSKGKHDRPVWSADGRYVYFNSDRSGIANVYVYDLQADKIKQLTDLSTGVDGALSLAKNKLVFTAVDDGSQGGINVYAIEYPLGKAFEPTDKVEPAADLTPRKSLLAAKSAAAASATDGLLAPQPPSPLAALVGSKERDANDREVYITNRGGTKVVPYKAKLTMDFQTQKSITATNYGTYGQFAFGMSDMLGNHHFNAAMIQSQYYGNAYSPYSGQSNSSDIFVNYANLKNRLDWGVGAFKVNYPFYTSLDGNRGAGYGNQSFMGVEGMAVYPVNSHRRWEGGLQASRVSSNQGSFTGNYVYPNVTHVFDNTLRGPLAPLSGTRYLANVGHLFGSIQNFRGYGDFRHYQHLGKEFVVATRVAGMAIEGKEIKDLQLQYFSGPYRVRGFDNYAVVGNRGVMSGVELRTPINLGLLRGLQSAGFFAFELGGFFDFAYAGMDKKYEQYVNSYYQLENSPGRVFLPNSQATNTTVSSAGFYVNVFLPLIGIPVEIYKAWPRMGGALGVKEPVYHCKPDSLGNLSCNSSRWGAAIKLRF
ncbi:MAG: PD40 domain-containing protein [Elusimicrobia bacterium]|nr:PD40 domain-containing protein [Elusimicrobiota bacterium]